MIPSSMPTGTPPDYANAVPNIVGRLSIKARAAGIFLIFAAQRPDKDVMPMQLRSQLGRIE